MPGMDHRNGNAAFYKAFSFYRTEFKRSAMCGETLPATSLEPVLLIARAPAKPGKMFAQRRVQPSVVCAHFAAIVSLEVVNIHRNLHQHAIEGEKCLRHLIGGFCL